MTSRRSGRWWPGPAAAAGRGAGTGDTTARRRGAVHTAADRRQGREAEGKGRTLKHSAGGGCCGEGQDGQRKARRRASRWGTFRGDRSVSTGALVTRVNTFVTAHPGVHLGPRHRAHGTFRLNVSTRRSARCSGKGAFGRSLTGQRTTTSASPVPDTRGRGRVSGLKCKEKFRSQNATREKHGDPGETARASRNLRSVTRNHARCGKDFTQPNDVQPPSPPRLSEGRAET